MYIMKAHNEVTNTKLFKKTRGICVSKGDNNFVIKCQTLGKKLKQLNYVFFVQDIHVIQEHNKVTK